MRTQVKNIVPTFLVSCVFTELLDMTVLVMEVVSCNTMTQSRKCVKPWFTFNKTSKRTFNSSKHKIIKTRFAWPNILKLQMMQNRFSLSIILSKELFCFFGEQMAN